MPVQERVYSAPHGPPCLIGDPHILAADLGFEPSSPVPETGRLTKKRRPQKSLVFVELKRVHRRKESNPGFPVWSRTCYRNTSPA